MKALIIDLKCQCIFLPEDVERVKTVLDRDYHMYAILLSNKYYLVKNKTKKEKDKIFLPIFSPTNETSYTIPFQIYNGLDHEKIKIDSPYPHEKFSIIIEDDDWKSENPDKGFQIEYNLTKIADKALFQNYIDFKYKVLYIGQAYGKKEGRNAIDRLLSHSKLQKILSDCQSKYTGYNIHILLLDFKQDQLVKSEYIGNTFAIKQFKPNFFKRQIINITEAALINYFKPEYNKDFISNFPSKKHTSYSQIYDAGCTEIALDLSYLFEAENLSSLNLYTECNHVSKEKNYIHYQLQKGEPILSSIPFDNEL